PLMGARRDQQMAVVVREAIEQHDRERRAANDQVAAIVLLSEAAADEARLVAGGSLRRRHVRQTPRRPELLEHRHSFELTAARVAGKRTKPWRNQGFARCTPSRDLPPRGVEPLS